MSQTPQDQPDKDAPSAFDAKQLQQQIYQHIRSKGGTAAVGGEAFLQQIVRTTMQALLDAEMTEHLGYDKHHPGPESSGNSRNGYGSKKLRGDFGEVVIQTPRDRDASFQPQVVGKRQTSVGNFSGKIVSLYARGLTTREIQQHLEEIYGIDVSPEFISRITMRIQDELLAWQNRPLQELYPIIYVDGMFISVRDGEGSGKVLKKCLYTVLGVDASGQQDVLGLWIAESEGARFWLKVLNDLKSRGARDVIILCGDGLPGLPDAAQAVFPKADVQLCVVHQIRSATRFVSWKHRKRFCADMRQIYTAPTLQAATAALEELDQTWGAQYPMSIASWRNHWENLTTFFRYPPELRGLIYTTNSIENLHGVLRKNTRSRRVFPSDDSAIRLHYLNVKNTMKRWKKRNGWDTVINQLAIMFPERINLNTVAST